MLPQELPQLEQDPVLVLSHQRAFLHHQSLPQLYFFYFVRLPQHLDQSFYLSMFGLPLLLIFVQAHNSHHLDQHKRNR